IDHLGRGANGSVDKVKNIFTGETYARKSVKIKKRGAAVEASFEREIQILRTRTHPSIPRFIDVYRDGATLNVLMEPAAELNLKQYLENPWKVQSCTQDILNWLRDITAGVAALHAPDSNNMSIRHGDIKPSNILVALRRTEANMATKLILIDFGASRAVPANDSESSSNCAKTPMYAAPEINEKERHGRKADIFSLACVFVELLT
ncbi:kinase-like protein, partial [Viridothelium virens]